jgi:hypothetical protein
VDAAREHSHVCLDALDGGGGASRLEPVTGGITGQAHQLAEQALAGVGRLVDGGRTWTIVRRDDARAARSRATSSAQPARSSSGS